MHGCDGTRHVAPTPRDLPDPAGTGDAAVTCGDHVASGGVSGRGEARTPEPTGVCRTCPSVADPRWAGVGQDIPGQAGGVPQMQIRT